MMMLSKDMAYQAFELIGKHARFDTAVLMAFGEEGLTRFANSEIHQNVYHADTEIRISVTQGKKTTTVTTNQLDDAALLDALKKAEDILPFLPEGEFALPPVLDDQEILIEAHEASFETTFGIEERATLLARAIGTLPDGFKAAGSLSLSHEVRAYGNNHGVRRYCSDSSVSLSGMVMHDSGASAYVGRTVTHPGELDVVAEMDAVCRKAARSLSPAMLEPGDYDVVLEPMAVEALIFYTGYLGFGSLHHETGTSCFAGKLGEKLVGANITLTDDHTHPMTRAFPFDFEGERRQKLTLIDHGVIGEIAHDRMTAARSGRKTTGHGFSAGNGGIPFHLVMEAGDSSLAEMIHSTKRGLLVSRFHYMNVVSPREGLLTALTRDGLFLIEDGVVTHPVHNLRFTDSLPRILSHVVALSAERTRTDGGFPSYVPAMKVKDFHFTGKTQIED